MKRTFSRRMMPAFCLVSILALQAGAQGSLPEARGDPNLSPEGQKDQHEDYAVETLDEMREALEEAAVDGENSKKLADRIRKLNNFMKKSGFVVPQYYLTEDGRLIKTDYQLSEKSPEGKRVSGSIWTKGEQEPKNIYGHIRVRDKRKIVVWGKR